MGWLVFAGVVVAIGVFGYLGQRFGLIDVLGKGKEKHSGGGSGIMGIGDEVFAPARHEAAMEMDRQTILPAPAPLAGDKGDESNIYDGVVKIDLDNLRRKGE
ncbi:MAG: hypothetical protein JWN80_1333 [Microbacteriaceae bacterium]|jgi:hypothetical protein|nr:hypothetical protein [Microbacteriaceae bacterium]